MLAAVVVSLRPRQWVKNLFVFAGLVFGQRLFTASFWPALAAFAIFCALSGAIYLLNDVADRQRDRLHPKKRERPVTAGRLSVGVALGAALELLLLRRLRGADIDTTMLVMIGAWIALQNAEQLAWTGVAKSIDTPFPAAPLVIGPVSVAWNRVFVFCVAIALIALTYALINHTKLGRAMRATFQDRETAALMGVQIGTIHTITFALGSGLAAAAGALLGPVFVAYPSMGDLAAAKAFAIVILGGLGSVPGATVGGFILALVEELGAGYISSGYRDAMGFLLIIVILVFRPTGLFARKERIG
jgi:branched-chain amino acid transport system permease protein